jgi:hypothetical protein
MELATSWHTNIKDAESARRPNKPICILLPQCYREDDDRREAASPQSIPVGRDNSIEAFL